MVLDSSAVLAVIFMEPGREVVLSQMQSACISAVNYAEVVTKLSDRAVPDGLVDDVLDQLELAVIPFDELLARRAGEMRAVTRTLGLSLGDRACLALAESLGCPAITTDKAWADLEIGITIELVR